MSEIEATAQARYKVAEVCRLADVQPYVLKYWESEFPVLAAPKGGGPRLYNGLELKIIERIKKLLYDEGYTIAGAKKRLETEMKDQAAAPAEAEPLVLTAPAPEAAESTATRRKRAKAAPPPPSVPEPDSALELADAPVFSVHAPAPESALSSSLEIDESPSPAGDVDLVPEPPAVASARTSPVVRKIDPVPAPMAQSPDPRVARALAELREIASLLSREEV